MKKARIDFTPKLSRLSGQTERQEQKIPVMHKDHIRYAYVEDLQDMLGIGREKAYRIIKELQQELPDKGIHEPANRIPREILMSKLYGGSGGEDDNGSVET